MTTQTTVTGCIFQPENGLPWVGAKVRFTLVPGSYTVDETYPSDRVTAVTDTSGNFSISLWANEGGIAASQYLCELPDKTKFAFILPASTTPLTLSQLRALENSDPAQQASVLSVVNTALNAKADKTYVDAGLAGKVSSSALSNYVLNTDGRLLDARNPLPHNQAWSTITSTPATLSGYGITDAANSTHTHTSFASLTLSGTITLQNAASNNLPVVLQTYFPPNIPTEVGLRVPLLGITNGRMDFDPLDQKAEIRVSGTTTQLGFYNTTLNRFYLRVNSDGDQFVTRNIWADGTIVAGTTNPSNSRFYVDGNSHTNGVHRLRTYTVATLPSASANPNAISYASNGRRVGEVSGAGSGIPVWNDGTNWRTYFDNSIVQA